MPAKTQGENVKVVAFSSHGGPLFGEINSTDHVASTPNPRQTNLSNNPHRPPNKMSVVLSPNRNLGFRRPLTQVAKRSLTITNTNSQPVAFKVKTTAPKLYCVRPNSGRVEPGESIDVSVMLQPLKEEPPLNSKCKDKFLVQSTVITPEKETMALHDLWSSPEMNDDGVVHQQKLRVLYLPAEEQTLEEEDENGVGNQTFGPSDFHQAFETTKIHPSANGHSHPGIPDFTEPNPPVTDETEPHFRTLMHVPPPVPPIAENHVLREHSNEDSGEGPEIPPVPSQPQPQAAAPLDEPVRQPPSPQAPQPPHDQYEESEPLPVPPPTHVPPPPSTIETVYVENPLNEELLTKYKEAQAEIDRLRANIATMSVAPTSELRSRRPRTNSDAGSTAETDVQTVVEEPTYQHQDGVPLQVVVIIALGVFITTYLFF